MVESEAYAPNTPLTRIFGNNTRPLILASLLSEPSNHLTKTEIAHLSGLSTRTVSRHLPTLVEHDLVETHPGDRGYMLYSINKDSPAAKRLAQMEWELLDVVADLHTKNRNDN